MSRQEREALAEKRKYTIITPDELTKNPIGDLGWKYVLYVTLFAALDIGGTTLGNIGYNNCDASIIQIIKGFSIFSLAINATDYFKLLPFYCH